MPTTQTPPPRPLSLTILGYLCILLGILALINIINLVVFQNGGRLDLTVFLFPLVGIGLLKGSTTAQGCLTYVIIILLVAAVIITAAAAFRIIEGLTTTPEANAPSPWSNILQIATFITLGLIIWKIIYSKKSKTYFEYHEDLKRQEHLAKNLNTKKSHPPPKTKTRNQKILTYNSKRNYITNQRLH